MSIFAVNYLCREVLRDHAFRAAMKADPAKALTALDLTDAERRAPVSYTHLTLPTICSV